ncbi:MAG: hypothetical protein M1829_000056 [Trizodia sp. TS-e1964]|nr:MAG: hypothetical protein M1829_000056 [Trizodia sp. TS-e1964]
MGRPKRKKAEVQADMEECMKLTPNLQAQFEAVDAEAKALREANAEKARAGLADVRAERGGRERAAPTKHKTPLFNADDEDCRSDDDVMSQINFATQISPKKGIQAINMPAPPAATRHGPSRLTSSLARGAQEKENGLQTLAAELPAQRRAELRRAALPRERIWLASKNEGPVVQSLQNIGSSTALPKAPSNSAGHEDRGVSPPDQRIVPEEKAIRVTKAHAPAPAPTTVRSRDTSQTRQLEDPPAVPRLSRTVSKAEPLAPKPAAAPPSAQLDPKSKDPLEVTAGPPPSKSFLVAVKSPPKSVEAPLTVKTLEQTPELEEVDATYADPWKGMNRIRQRETRIPKDQLVLLSREDSWFASRSTTLPSVPGALLKELRERSNKSGDIPANIENPDGTRKDVAEVGIPKSTALPNSSLEAPSQKRVPESPILSQSRSFSPSLPDDSKDDNSASESEEPVSEAQWPNSPPHQPAKEIAEAQRASPGESSPRKAVKRVVRSSNLLPLDSSAESLVRGQKPRETQASTTHEPPSSPPQPFADNKDGGLAPDSSASMEVFDPTQEPGTRRDDLNLVAESSAELPTFTHTSHIQTQESIVFQSKVPYVRLAKGELPPDSSPPEALRVSKKTLAETSVGVVSQSSGLPLPAASPRKRKHTPGVGNGDESDPSTPRGKRKKYGRTSTVSPDASESESEEVFSTPPTHGRDLSSRRKVPEPSPLRKLARGGRSVQASSLGPPQQFASFLHPAFVEDKEDGGGGEDSSEEEEDDSEEEYEDSEEEEEEEFEMAEEEREEEEKMQDQEEDIEEDLEKDYKTFVSNSKPRPVSDKSDKENEHPTPDTGQITTIKETVLRPAAPLNNLNPQPSSMRINQTPQTPTPWMKPIFDGKTPEATQEQEAADITKETLDEVLPQLKPSPRKRSPNGDTAIRPALKRRKLVPRLNQPLNFSQDNRHEIDHRLLAQASRQRFLSTLAPPPESRATDPPSQRHTWVSPEPRAKRSSFAGYNNTSTLSGQATTANPSPKPTGQPHLRRASMVHSPAPRAHTVCRFQLPASSSRRASSLGGRSAVHWPRLSSESRGTPRSTPLMKRGWARGALWPVSPATPVEKKEVGVEQASLQPLPWASSPPDAGHKEGETAAQQQEDVAETSPQHEMEEAPAQVSLWREPYSPYNAWARNYGELRSVRDERARMGVAGAVRGHIDVLAWEL